MLRKGKAGAMNVLLKGGLVYSKGRFQKNDILISDGVISAISFDLSEARRDFEFDLNNIYLFPGFADVHVHLREPGFSYKETIKSGTMAAARGGYTLLCAMPNTNPVIDSPENLSLLQKQINDEAVIKVYSYAAISKGENGEKLTEHEAMASLAAGFSDDGKGVQSPELMKSAMLRAKKLNKIIAAHCEDEKLLGGSAIHNGKYAKALGIKGISSESEWVQVKRDISLVRETRCSYHVCHVSTKESVELIRRAKAERLPVSCETAPHYLVLSEDNLLDEGRFKMNPPLRTEEDRRALIAGILDGTIDVIATDHAPHSIDEKSGGLLNSLMGVVGLETAFPVLYTKLVKTGIISLEKLIELMSIKPRRLFGFGGGQIDIGEKAEICAFDLLSTYKVDPKNFLTKGRATPFEGMEVSGECVLTVYGEDTVWRKDI